MGDTEVVELFGKPRKINRTTTSAGVREQWYILIKKTFILKMEY